MFQVQPLRDRKLQEEMSALLGCPFFESTFAFFAGEMAEDCATVTSLIGMCQFTYNPTLPVIKSIAYAPECEKDEAVIILVRAVMNFMYRADIPEVAIEADAAPAEFIKSLGFRERDGILKIDLKKFYRSPCHYEAD